MLKRLVIFVLLSLFVVTGCKGKEAKELLDKGTLRSATGRITAVGPRYITMQDQTGKDISISNVTNISRWGHMPETFLRDQTNVTIVYKTVYGNTADDFTNTVESMTEEK